MKRVIIIFLLTVFFNSCTGTSYKGAIKLLTVDNNIVKINSIINSERSEIILNELKSTDELKFGEDTNTILYLRKNNGTSFLGKYTIDKMIDEKIFETNFMISSFITYNGYIYYKSSSEVSREPVMIMVYDPSSGTSKIIIKIEEGKEYISAFSVIGDTVYYILSGFGIQDLYSYDLNEQKTVLIKSAVADVFSNGTSLIVETMNLDTNSYSSTIEYTSTLTLYNSGNLMDLGLVYERMGGVPIIVDNEKMILPIERNYLRNQLKSFPFGFQDKNISFIVFDYKNRHNLGTVFNTNTKEFSILDARIL